MKPDPLACHTIITRFCRQHLIDQCISKLQQDSWLAVTNLIGVGVGLFAYALAKRLGSPLVILTEHDDQAESLFDDFGLFDFDIPLGLIPAKNISHSAPLFSDLDSFQEFFINQALQLLNDHKPALLVTTPQSLSSKVPSQFTWNKLTLSLHCDQIYPRDKLVNHLEQIGYSKVDIVENRLEYCLRGGIIDIFSPGEALPVRIEFDGDIIASIRYFNPESQLSLKSIIATTITPATQQILDSSAAVTILEYLPTDTIIITLLDDEVLLGDIKSISAVHGFKLVEVSKLGNSHFDYAIYPTELKTIQDLQRHLATIRQNYSDPQIYLFCGSEAQCERLAHLLKDDAVHYSVGAFNQGVEMPQIGVFLYTDYEIFKRTRSTNIFRRLYPELPSKPFDPKELSTGDFMVHVDYGIGRFVGLNKITAFGATRECLVLEYADADRVYVPLEKMHLVHKYLGTEGFVPRLNHLGRTDWEKTRLRTKRSVYQLSQTLINLYAQRIHSSRPSYPQDNDLQLQLESAFWFEETPDQIAATKEIKKDLETDHPMDRLLCGDVGFGKTEVALRAAFKVVLGSKQVAVLAPTTILADQHFAVFSRRFQDFPVKIALLTRFVSPKQQRQILQELASGKIDIVIGTHRLLSPDVAFKELGLLIIDEEHRFGVKAKEHLKIKRTQVDVLSLSATPIPRSLYMSLIGVRDFSVIKTPPKSRLPILTEVILFDPVLIRDAILRELERGGQVYFVHNDIASLARISHKLSELVPEASLAYAHGKMPARELERIMRRFIEGELNVLVTTTIIESGIDIPNANTIFINDAHHYGLAQLYQLRGRVGRSNRRAYAYLIVPTFSHLKPDAVLKLKAITRHSALGSGYQLALHDLEIRGVGNIFGVEQSGNVQALGYELYMKILKEAFDRLKAGEKLDSLALATDEIVDTEIVFPFAALLPDDYVPLKAQRLHYYRRLSEARSQVDLDQIEKELIDIFGNLPPAGRGLIELHSLRVLASALSIKKMFLVPDIQIFWSDRAQPIKPEVLLPAVKSVAQQNNW